MTNQTEREKFEQWAQDKNKKKEGAFMVTAISNGVYISAETRCALEAWQAATARHHKELSEAKARIAELELVENSKYIDKVGADRLACACVKLIQSNQLDTRSEVADALLDYLDIGGSSGCKSVPEWLIVYNKAMEGS